MGLFLFISGIFFLGLKEVMGGLCFYSDLLYFFILGFILRLMSIKMMFGDCFCLYCVFNYCLLY